VLTNAIGSSPGHYAAKAFDLIQPALQSALDSPDDAPVRDGSLARYASVYGSIWGQTVVVPWKDGLAMLNLASSNPADDMERLKHVEDHTFQRVRGDDESLGETIQFEMDDDGSARRFSRHSIWKERLY
jgi:hypothetical protein